MSEEIKDAEYKDLLEEEAPDPTEDDPLPKEATRTQAPQARPAAKAQKKESWLTSKTLIDGLILLAIAGIVTIIVSVKPVINTAPRAEAMEEKLKVAETRAEAAEKALAAEKVAYQELADWAEAAEAKLKEAGLIEDPTSPSVGE